MAEEHGDGIAIQSESHKFQKDKMKYGNPPMTILMKKLLGPLKFKDKRGKYITKDDLAKIRSKKK